MNINSDFTAIILAAGKGVRMKSNLPKVLHKLREEPLIGHVLKILRSVKQIKQIVVVTGYEAKAVEGYISKKFSNIDFVRQNKLSGTAGAVKCAEKKVKSNNVLILCGDAPLVAKETISLFISSYKKQNLKSAVVSACIEADNDLGRIIRDRNGNIKSICEKQDLAKYFSSGQNLREVNSGLYIFDKSVLFQNLNEIKKNNKKGEYFLTDLIEILYRKQFQIGSYFLKNNDEILGINNKKDLLAAELILNQRMVEMLIDKGVTVIDPKTTFVKNNVKIGKNTLIYPFTFIEKNVIIGSHCHLGPFIHIREGTRVANNVTLGNFAEICRSSIGAGTKIKHFSYIGDATINQGVNVGAGTVVANYSGGIKSKTVIKNKAFIGSNSVLVAPITIGEAAITGAGSVVCKDVKPETIVVGVPAKFLKKITK